MFKFLAIEFGNDFSIFGHFQFKDDSLHGGGSRIRIFAAVHIQFRFFIAYRYNTVHMSVKFCFPFLRRSESCAAEAWGYTQDTSFVNRQFSLPVYVPFFTVPTEVYFYFAAYRVTFGSNRSQWTIHTGQNLSVLYDIYIVDTTFSVNVQIDTAAVATYYIAHKSIVETEVY